ncbi:GNAT family N-acetyltransferase [Bacillus sp. Marseille-Q3570]|uniref:GNAT family N-acetyltransferase n=1 Tax=Bacillus sp. Marseille-Q3570 TaxID=2963522 RepID=UPI0021B7F5F5|nr:GNAT family N-acetyltransferase [Bacillus sp. Marseille-Q3570]
MEEIYELKERQDLFNKAVEIFWKQWGTQGNYKFYYESMIHSCDTESELPRFYIAVKNEKIIGFYALLRNDLVSRQDLTPWFACLFVAPESRGSGLGSRMLEHAAEEAREKGYTSLYLSTDLEGYYEKYGWELLTEGYSVTGEPTNIYMKSAND